MAQNQTYVSLVFCKQRAAPVFSEYLSSPWPLLNLSLSIYVGTELTL